MLRPKKTMISKVRHKITHKTSMIKTQISRNRQVKTKMMLIKIAMRISMQTSKKLLQSAKDIWMSLAFL